jgi:hypothetical protein
VLVLEIPAAVVALPCGSKSINKTFLLVAARLAAKFTAVVVLPTPPFLIGYGNYFIHYFLLEPYSFHVFYVSSLIISYKYRFLSISVSSS